MNETLKAAGHIGAELGAAMVENARLRGLLRDAIKEMEDWKYSFPDARHNQTNELLSRIDASLSQQAEPADRCISDGGTCGLGGTCQECPHVEPAPAQDELNDGIINEITYNTLGQWPSFEAQSWACKVVHAVMAARPAQQPVEVVAWANPVDLEELKISRRSSARYVINSKSGAANVPLVRQSDHLAALLAATAPQPAQSGLVEALDGRETLDAYCGWYRREHGRSPFRAKSNPEFLAFEGGASWQATRPAQTEQQPEQEPFWYAVVSEQAPTINSAIRRLDVAQEFADSKRERWPDTRVVPLYTAPQPEQSGLRPIHAMILNALDRDAAEGKAARGEMAAELRAALKGGRE